MSSISRFIKENMAVGLLLFALFLGAGNVIFPPLLGQQAGENLIPAMIGFLITGVGLPLIAIVAVAKSGGDLYLLANRVHPTFGVIFTSIVYLTIGPLFAVPRTGSVTYEIGVVSLLPTAWQASPLPLFITSIVFFGLIIYLAMNPSKMVDRIGKLLTPVLLVVILLLFIKSILTPMGKIGAATGNYINNPLAEGFIRGYLTIDVLGALVFGIVILQTLKDRNILEPKKQITTTIFAGLIAAVGLSFVYIALSYVGATSTEAIGTASNGGQILARVAVVLFGDIGTIILSITIFLACLTTAVGLVSANAQFFSRLLPKISYKAFIYLFSLSSLAVTNVGLSTLVKTSMPILLFIYPIAIVLMIVSFFDHHFEQKSYVYALVLIPTAFVSLYDALQTAEITVPLYESILQTLPLYEQKIGWVVPAIIGYIIGQIIYTITKQKTR